MGAEIKLTKERVLGQVSTDLMLKGQMLLEQGHAKAAEAVFRMSVDVVSREEKESSPDQAPQSKP